MINARSEGDHNPDNDPRYTGAMGISTEAHVSAIHSGSPVPHHCRRNHRRSAPRKAHQALPRLCPKWRSSVCNGRHLGRMDANPSTGEITRSFAILTTVSNRLMERIGHHRSPVMLHEKDEQDLDQSDADTAARCHRTASPISRAFVECLSQSHPPSAIPVPTVRICSNPSGTARAPRTRPTPSTTTWRCLEWGIRESIPAQLRTSSPGGQGGVVPLNSPVPCIVHCHSWFSLRYGLMQPRELLD